MATTASPGYTRWFERMLAEQGHELWVGDAATIRAAMVRKQKTDSHDARPILDLLLTDRFPRTWIPSVAERDARQRLRHRYKLVCFRTSVRNQLHAQAMGEGIRRKRKLWTAKGRQELESLALGGWASRRREDLLGMLGRLHPRDRGVGPGGDRGSPESSPGGAFDGASGSGTSDGTGPALRDADDGAGGAFSQEQAGGQLGGVESEGE